MRNNANISLSNAKKSLKSYENKINRNLSGIGEEA